jgi:hypothetical protein
MDVVPPRARFTSSRSAFPRTQTTRSPMSWRSVSTSTGCGPAAMSPVSTIRSAAMTSGSASTARSAGSTAWMSDSTASMC